MKSVAVVADPVATPRLRATSTMQASPLAPPLGTTVFMKTALNQAGKVCERGTCAPTTLNERV